MFVYWGRRGALTQFTREVAHAALACEDLSPVISVSRQNELFQSFEELDAQLFPINTFQHSLSAVFQAWRVILLRRQLYSRLRAEKTQLVVELMPHIWSFMVMPVVRKAGAKYCTIVHDADAHPGDHTALANVVLDRVLPLADVVFTLSGAVAGRLRARNAVPAEKLFPLHHPDLLYSGGRPPRPIRLPGQPMRLLFLGRIMAYKGLRLFIDAVNLLRSEGFRVEIGVFGEGPLGEDARALDEMGAEVVNRWLSGAEISNVLARYDLVVLSHIQASQSGVAATAFGAGVPVVATPVGGLVEQVIDGITGIMADRADSDALAEAIKQMILNPEFYNATCRNLIRTSDERSMSRFIQDVISQGLA